VRALASNAACVAFGNSIARLTPRPVRTSAISYCFGVLGAQDIQSESLLAEIQPNARAMRSDERSVPSPLIVAAADKSPRTFGEAWRPFPQVRGAYLPSGSNAAPAVSRGPTGKCGPMSHVSQIVRGGVPK
jgi:hypothetical protein